MRHDFNLLAVFGAVMEERNVTAAARRLGLSQSAVSAALGRLRDRFGDPLFVRARYGVVPTEKAHEIAPAVARALAELERVYRDAPAFDPATATRRFRIAAGAYFECVVVPEVMARAAGTAPGVGLEIEPLGPDPDPRAMAAGEIDVALGRFAEEPDQLVVTPVLEDRFCCLVRRDAVPGQSALTRAQFEAMPHVVVSPPGRWRTGVFRSLAEAGLHRRVALTVSHFLAAPIAVARIGGIATVPMRVAALCAADARLRTVDPPSDLGPFPMQAAWHPRHRRDPGHTWLRRLIREVCESLP